MTFLFNIIIFSSSFIFMQIIIIIIRFNFFLGGGALDK